METAHETLHLEERIRIRAYELYLQRGTQFGSTVGDWLQAEEEIRRASDSRHAVSESEFGVWANCFPPRSKMPSPSFTHMRNSIARLLKTRRSLVP